jgi:hypothetical protein
LKHVCSATWSFPILNGDRQLIGVKLHRDPPLNDAPKGGWLTKGGAALFPLPGAQGLKPGAEIILTPGELKALAYIDAARPATSPTTGESTHLQTWRRAYAEAFRGLRVVIDPDREISPAAHCFVKNAIEALQGVALSLEVLK